MAELVREGHKIAVFHGDRTQTIPMASPTLTCLEDHEQGQAAAITPVCAAGLVGIRSENQYISASLARLGVPVLGLCSSDAGICRLRKVDSGNKSVIEATQIDPRWLQIICDHGGVPILCNLALAPWGEYYLVDADHMAAVCAGNWKVDALVYLTSVDGVRSHNGSLMRWLDLSDIEALRAQHFVSGDMLLKLKRCRDALRQGVGRVRILPAANADVLQSIFSSRMEYGTEIYIGQA